MRKFWSVSGQLVEVQRYINVPMRWCEQYPARERRELWVSTAGGNDVKLIVHSRVMPARRGHEVTALLLGKWVVGLHNASTGEQVSFVREDPSLLLRRCDGMVALCLSMVGLAAVPIWGWPTLLLSLPVTVTYLPVLVVVRLVLRSRVRAQVERALETVRGRETAQPILRRVK